MSFRPTFRFLAMLTMFLSMFLLIPALIDYVDVVIHILQYETREYYNLEGLWGDAIIKKVN